MINMIKREGVIIYNCCKYFQEPFESKSQPMAENIGEAQNCCKYCQRTF